MLPRVSCLTAVFRPVAAGVIVLVVSAPVAAQQTTGTPGSPSATTTIDGRYLPAQPQPFGGVINLTRRTPLLLARAGGAAQRGAQHPADHDR